MIEESLRAKPQIDKKLLEVELIKPQINMLESKTQCCPSELHQQVTKILLKIQNKGYKNLYKY